MAFCTKPLANMANLEDCSKPQSAGIEKIVFYNYKSASATVADNVQIFDTIPETSHFESTVSFNEDSKTTSWQNSIFIQFASTVQKEGRDAVNALANTWLACICYLTDGSVAYFGKTDEDYIPTTTDEFPTWKKAGEYNMTYPARVTAGNINSGTKMDDAHGIDATVTVKSVQAPVVVPAPLTNAQKADVKPVRE